MGGNFDPPPEKGPDNDKQVGNIFNVMMYYPTKFTFTLIGKIDPSNDAEVQEFVNDIKLNIASVLLSSTTTKNDDDDDEDNKNINMNSNAIDIDEDIFKIMDNIEVSIIPRGKKFIKVLMGVMVQNGNDISMIYESLSSIDNIVMKF